MKNKRILLVFIVLVLTLTSACRFVDDLLAMGDAPTPTPELVTPVDVTQQFIDLLNAGKPENALDLVCDSMALPNLQQDTFRDVTYEEVSNYDTYAEVRVIGEIRFEVKALGAVKKDMDFLMMLDRDGENWCINNDSVTNFFLSLFNFGE
jgi:hypothetical protein